MRTMSGLKDYLTIQEFAKEAGVTDAAIKKAIYEGRIKGEKIGRQWLVRQSELDRYLNEK